jgi:hypothetical protein
VTTLRARLEDELLAKIAADWKCEACGAEHGKPHPSAPSTLVFLRVVDGRAACQFCVPDEFL